MHLRLCWTRLGRETRKVTYNGEARKSRHIFALLGGKSELVMPTFTGSHYMVQKVQSWNPIAIQFEEGRKMSLIQEQAQSLKPVWHDKVTGLEI